MNNGISSEYLSELITNCMQTLNLNASKFEDLPDYERASAYYSLYHKNKIHLLLVSNTYKGLDATFTQTGKVFEELSYHYFDTLPTILTTIHCLELINSIADDNKKIFLLNQVIDSKKPFAFCLTEENAGSDITSITTTAIKDGKQFIINGKKDIVINSGIASFYILFARSGKKGRAGLNAFLIPENAKGLLTNKLMLDSFYNSVLGTVILENVTIGDEYQIGEDGSGYFLLTEMLDKGRPLVAACCVGGAQRAFDIILEHTKKRKQFSKTLYNFQGINFPIAEFATRIHAARLLYQDACKKIDNGEPFSKESSMAKYFASRLFLDITTFGMDVLGYRSIIDRSEIKHLNNCAHTMMFIDGTENVQKMIIASLL